MMNTTTYAKQELENMTVGNTKVINGKAVTRWNLIRWEVGTWGTGNTTNLPETLIALGFDAEQDEEPVMPWE